ncbi:hypothetical protein G9A89_009772 [Geosiphon pyriformis]|nr:hypothetical protein G9A89_009772 [Geosiphon pyriformis]
MRHSIIASFALSLAFIVFISADFVINTPHNQPRGSKLTIRWKWDGDFYAKGKLLMMNMTRANDIKLLSNVILSKESYQWTVNVYQATYQIVLEAPNNRSISSGPFKITSELPSSSFGGSKFIGPSTTIPSLNFNNKADQNNEIFGSEMTKSQIKNTKFTLGNSFRAGINNMEFRIDSYWWKSWPDRSFRQFDGRIKDFIKELRSGGNVYDPINIIITGHGIGGFYAEIYGILIKNIPAINEKVYINVITFGAPRPGDHQFAALAQKGFKYNLKVYRITHSNDYFPHFPKISTDGKPYMHPGTEYWIPDDKNCNCKDPDADSILRAGYDIVYECQGYSLKDKEKYGEHPECNLGTDGEGTRAHFGPYFGVTFGSCDQNYSIL